MLASLYRRAKPCLQLQVSQTSVPKTPAPETAAFKHFHCLDHLAMPMGKCGKFLPNGNIWVCLTLG